MQFDFSVDWSSMCSLPNCSPVGANFHGAVIFIFTINYIHLIIAATYVMMFQMSRPGAWGRVWNLLTKSFANNVPKKYIAEDSYGNKYYEFHKTRSNITRGYDPPASGHQQHPSIEWESWLKGTRRFPPSEQEIQLNRQRQQAQVLQDTVTEKRAPRIDSTGKGFADIDRPKQYPQYDDYESTPGSKPADFNRNK
uniref:NADH dehydrogenase [ubiquinone] 1 alpha subcomplex subunit 12 n=1 Tax=Steinernema glaseri TaxID=37863 RepID=A0A1I7ZC09_9BILA